jgi:hypothetical protein
VRRESTVKPKRARKERSSAGRRGALAEERRAKEGRGAERRAEAMEKEKEGKERSDQRRRDGLLCSAVREEWESQREERLSSSSLSSSLRSKIQRPGRSSSKEPIGKE